MDTLKKATHVNGKDHSHKRATVGLAATSLLKQTKKRANGLYKNSAKKVAKAEKSFKEHTDTWAKTVQKNPITSVIVASGIGYVLASLFRR